MNPEEQTIHILLETINRKIDSGVLTRKAMAETLGIHEKTLATKLNGKYPFTLNEFVRLTMACNFDVNETINQTDGYRFLKLLDYNWSYENNAGPDELNYFLECYRRGANGGNSEVMMTCTRYPKFILWVCDYLPKFEWLLSRYHNDRNFSMDPGRYKDIPFETEYHRQFMGILKTFNKFSCVLSIHMMTNIANQLSYFYDIKFMDEEDVRQIITDCYKFLDWLELLCNAGTFENGNPVEILFTEHTLTTEFNVVTSDNYKYATMQLHYENVAVTEDPDLVALLNEWYISDKKISTTISTSSEFARKQFFNTQRGDFERLTSKFQE